MKREQPKKDSDTKRINLDNESKRKFDKAYEPRQKQKGKKPRNKSNQQNHKQGKTEPGIKEAAKKTNANDASWYSKNPTLLAAAGSLPFATIAGTGVLPGEQSVPGIMSFQYVHNYNMADEANALRQAFDAQYSFLVHANSRNYTYDAIDLGIMECAGFEVFSMIAHMIRAYGIARFYEEENLYNGKQILEVLGFDADNFYNNLGQIWFDINLLIDRSRQIWVPNTMPLLARWIWMNSTIFTDGEGKRAQFYMYVPSCFYKFADHVGEKIGSALVTVASNQFTDFIGFNSNPFGQVGAVSTETHVWSGWKKAANDMIDALVNSQDRGIIYGDILNAYGADKIFAYPAVPADYKIAPIYNPEVLTQFENATTCRGYHPIAYMQEQGKFITPVFMKYQPISGQTNQFWAEYQTPEYPIINFHIPEQPKPDNIMVATRMMCCGSNTVLDSYAASVDDVQSKTAIINTKQFQPKPATAGSEICTDMVSFRYSKSQNKLIGKALSYGVHSTTHVEAERKAAMGEWAWNAIPFDWSPTYYAMETTTNNTPHNGKALTEDYNVLTEFDNYIVTNFMELRKLHQVAIFSLLDVPTI